MTDRASLFRIALVALIISGCAHELNRRNADKYYDLGLRAEAQGNYAGARESFWRAWVNARDGEASSTYKSAVLYNLGRMTGYTCDFSQAEKLLQDALDMEIPLSGPDSGNISKRLFELARISFDQRKYAEAARFYERGIPMAERLGIEKDDPIILANSLDELAQSYEESGQSAKAVSPRSRAAAIRARYPNQSAKFVPVRYSKQCSK